MDTKLTKYLARLSLFKDVPQPVLAQIASQIERHHLAKGTVLIRKGEQSDSLFIIRTGWVKVIAEGNNGEEVVLNQCGPGQVIGEMSLIDQEPRSGTVVLISSAEVLEIKYSTVLEALNDYPQLLHDDAQTIAVTIVERFGRDYDDAACIALRYRR